MWESIVKGFERILERPAILVLILGALLFVLGAGNGITYNALLPLDDTKAWVSLGVGLVLLAGGAVLSTQADTKTVPAGSYEIKITSPKDKETIEVANVIGAIDRLPPTGYKLMIFRIYPEGDFVPLTEARLEPDGKGWNAPGCDIGGKTGNTRIIGAYLVGKSGQALIQYYKAATDFHRQVKTNPNEFLPRISVKTEDMIRGDEVLVFRK
jgi:hypothetical protein